MAENIVIVGAKRTPIGSMQGKFNSIGKSPEMTNYLHVRREP